MYIFGASGHGKVIASILLADKSIEQVVFVDDAPKFTTLMHLPVVLSLTIANFRDKKVIVGVGNNAIRKEVVARLQALFFTAVHPSSSVCSTARVGIGSAVMAQAVINADAVVGLHCIVNSGAVVEHDCILEDYVHVSPNAALAGGVCVGEGSHVGIGAVVLQGIKIGKWATIGAGAVVLSDVPDYAVVVGNPAKIIKYVTPN